MVIHAASCWMAGRVLQPQRVVAAPANAPGSGAIYAMMGCPVHRRGRDVLLCYGTVDAARPLLADRFDLWPSFLFETYRQITAANEPVPVQSTEGHVRALLMTAPIGQESVALRLAMSPATLRRRLREEGTSFRAIQADVRRQLTENALHTDCRLDDLAADLGYSEGRSLRRAVKRWFGAPPSELRHKAHS